MRRCFFFCLVLSCCCLALAGYTDVHHQGYCATYDNCGKKSIFGGELPCPANVPASIPTQDDKDLLVSICGPLWENQSLVCCSNSQLNVLQQQLKKADNIIASCPACRDNFYQLFCRFSCSPNQSQFVNVTQIQSSISKKPIVKEIDQYVDPSWAENFYDSCKNVKFGATNGYAMDLIGGGAKDYKQFLKFLGDEKPLLGGSPFQINFKWPQDDYLSLPPDIKPSNGLVKYCNDSNPDFKCACSDCPNSCPTLPNWNEKLSCHVGLLPCFSFSIILLYIILALFYFSGYLGYLYYNHFNINKNLLQDDSLDNTTHNSIDDDELDSNFTNDLDHDDISHLSGRLLSSSQHNQSYFINNLLEKWFGKLAFICALHPWIIISVALAITFLLSSGMFFIKLEKNPINLWVSSSAEAFKQKQFFDQNFGPFYKAEQIFIVNDTGPVLNYNTLNWWFDIETKINQLSIDYIDSSDENNIDLNKINQIYKISLDDICLKPTGDACVIESFTQYFQGDPSLLDPNTWEKDLTECATSPVNCLPPFQQPLKKELLFGGYQNNDILTSKALVITYVINNNIDDQSQISKATEQWEKLLESFLLNNVTKEAQDLGLRVSFTTDISLEKELNKSTNTDIKIIIISYLMMFSYASLALSGGLPSFDNIDTFVNTKISIGLAGIFIVLLSVSSSAGLFALFGVKSTLIIAEVIPFLILAVGVDNIFLICHELKHMNRSYPNESVPERVSRAVGRMGPSILLSATSQFLAFSLGAFVAMPAVRNFALYSAGASFFNTSLQLTAFVSLLALDQQRTDDMKLDIFPWVKVESIRSKSITNSERGLLIPEILSQPDETVFSRLLRKYYAPFILKKKVKPVILAIFIAWFGVSLALFPKIKFGLDQRIAIPSDSYLIDYFNDIYDYFNTGAPVYFVVKDLNVTQRENQQKLCGRFSTCDEYSLTNILEQERKRPEFSTLAEPAASWIDDFFLFLNPDLDECCRFRKNTNQTQVCSPFDSSRRCEACFLNHEPKWDTSMKGFPEGEEFLKFLDIWIETPSSPCPLGGKAPYSRSVVINEEGVTVEASTFRTSHVPLRSQDDFIKGYRSSLRITSDIKKYTGLDVFAYSPFYIFFVQYETIVSLTFTLLGTALIILFFNSSLLLGSFRTAGVLSGTVLLILVDIGGVMAIWNISLNAVALVNLVICTGIAVEFCTHIARGFTVADQLEFGGRSCGTRVQRSFHSLTGIGGSVFGGIALTKLIGVFVLAFTRSKIFQVYYFRMWLALVVIASLHSLMFLPIVLSYCGGRSYIFSSKVSAVSDDLASRLRFNEISGNDSDD
ncbi:sphingolipid transporter [Ascoidea rubescens DSM 1968]|uniref:Vacuolar membrane protein that transits through the biosynthetic vacuolar protein sorting pathway n=1 Tax=Ascoidea rubescens DSM 1968 TaxID=1344418 RepID=A0A1D2VR30_9ASCO|nr:vacuolar membrane protein that transits through the biosynthetic vacuolar protein sorting pathway [Ascoidea rubescens DSM 1968]ODV64049.1 vacuolar membrane protein that transits through the biosynthetic vacuolar protein sorting pathway [Ascoidea rubescens DSM 1968]